MKEPSSRSALGRVLLVIVLMVSNAIGWQQIARAFSASVPDALPAHFGIGLDAADNATGLTGWMPDSGVPWDYAYTYLTGGVNTSGAWWNTWADNGTFPLHYGSNAVQHGYTPVFIYYTLLASNGPCNSCVASHRGFANLNDPDLMKSYFQNFTLLLQRLSTGTYDGITGLGKTAIIDVEPDLSGMVEQATRSGNCFGYCTGQGDSPTYMTAAVASSGDPDVAGYPNSFQGFNWALLHLRDLYAPNVLMAVHVSDWATNIDIGSNRDPSVNAVALGRVAGGFAAASGAVTAPPGTSTYNLVFNDPSDHDAGWQSRVNNNPGVWWDRNNVTLPDFHQWEEYISGIYQATGKGVIAWQVPMGNQYFDTENNTPYHYQDNRVEYFFHHVPELVQSGLVGVLFGQDGVNTHYYDADNDGVINPAPICASLGSSAGPICNNHTSTISDDDGGYLRMVARQYYDAGPYPLPSLGATAAVVNGATIANGAVLLPYNTSAISADGEASTASLDGYGFTYSATALRTAGIRPGAQIKAGGLSFAWPNSPPGGLDDVEALGQAIPITPATRGTTLGFIGMATAGPSGGTGTIIYADGSTQSFTLAFSDWALDNHAHSAPIPKNSVVVAVPYRNRQDGTTDETTVFLFYTGVALDPSKRVVSVTLPGSVNGGPLHIFAMSIGTPAGHPAATPAGSTSGRAGGNRPPGTTPIAGVPHLSRRTVTPGESLVGTATLWNPGKTAIALHDVVLAGRPPHGTNAGGPFDDFGGTGPVTLKPGQRLTIREARTFIASDPRGVWRTYVTYQTPDGLWHDDPHDATFLVVARVTPRKPVTKATATRRTATPAATRAPTRPAPTATRTPGRPRPTPTPHR
jgi:hypothetical protein